MKNVLIVAYVFPPMAGSGVYRTLKFVKYLPEWGWMPTVITIKPYPGHAVDPSLCEEVPPDVEVLRTYSLEPRRLPFSPRRLASKQGVTSSDKPVTAQSSLSRLSLLGRTVYSPWLLNRLRSFFFVPDHCIGWLPFILRAASKTMKSKKIDVLYTSFPPGTAAVAGDILKQRYGIPWVVDFRDPWLRHPAVQGRFPTRLHLKVARALERRAVLASDKVVSATEIMTEDILADYPELKPQRITTLTNGFDEDDYLDIDGTAPDPERFTLSYAGEFPGIRLGPFLRATERLIKDRPGETASWRLVFVGEGEAAIRQLLDPCMARIVETPGHLPHRETLRRLRKSDVLLCFDRGRAFYTTKAFEYLRVKRPILALAQPDGMLGSLVDRAGAGIVAPPEDEVAIAKALWELYTRHTERNGSFTASDEFLAQYERKTLTGKLARVFDEVAQKPSRLRS